MTTATDRAALIERLRAASEEIAHEGHNGWGNLCWEAAEALEALSSSASSETSFDPNERVQMPFKTVPAYLPRVTPVRATMRPPTEDEAASSDPQEERPASGSKAVQDVHDAFENLWFLYPEETFEGPLSRSWDAVREAIARLQGEAQSSPVPHEAETVIEVSSEKFGRIWDRAVAGPQGDPPVEGET